jgi:hypothetical protein
MGASAEFRISEVAGTGSIHDVAVKIAGELAA